MTERNVRKAGPTVISRLNDQQLRTLLGVSIMSLDAAARRILLPRFGVSHDLRTLLDAAIVLLDSRARQLSLTPIDADLLVHPCNPPAAALWHILGELQRHADDV